MIPKKATHVFFLLRFSTCLDPFQLNTQIQENKKNFFLGFFHFFICNIHIQKPKTKTQRKKMQQIYIQQVDGEFTLHVKKTHVSQTRFLHVPKFAEFVACLQSEGVAVHNTVFWDGTLLTPESYQLLLQKPTHEPIMLFAYHSKL